MRRRTGSLRHARLLLIAGLLLTGIAAACLAQGAGEPPGEADKPKDNADEPKMSMLQLLVKGGWFMVPIGACSLLGLAIVIERLIALRRGAVIPSNFMGGLKGVFRHGEQDRSAGLEYCRSGDSPIARVAAAGIRKMRRGEQAVEQAIEDAGANEVSKLRRNLRVLYGVAAVAPMLGLLGTVWGMIQAFQATSKKGMTGSEKSTSLANGIWEALVTTFGGLVVAIPVLIFYYYFLGRIDRIVHEMNEVSIEFVEHYLGEDAAAGGAAA